MTQIGLIANILHRDTIVALVGARTYERGERCLRGGRVVSFLAGLGQLSGVVQPTEQGRSNYEVRIWIREDGVAYRCTCPVGCEGRFCKHAVALALAHVERVEHEGERKLASLRDALLSRTNLVDDLLTAARADDRLRSALEAFCLA
jgi:uncharacterized Zn finger protein